MHDLLRSSPLTRNINRNQSKSLTRLGQKTLHDEFHNECLEFAPISGRSHLHLGMTESAPSAAVDPP